MASSPAIDDVATEVLNPAPVDMKVEVVIIPVSDVDRSKRFYEHLGWRVDVDFVFSADFRVVHMTPPGSACSIAFGKGVTPAAPGSARGLILVVSDLEKARTELVRLDVGVSEIFHFESGFHVMGTKGHLPGADPQGRSYFTFASFRDPDGNDWLLQEVKGRAPGRGFSSSVGELTEVLREAEKFHGVYEAKAPKHHWSDWYAAYVAARERGSSPEEATEAAGHHMKTVLR